MSDNLATRRRTALASGEKFYFTGRACKSGHIAKRRAANGVCHVCEEIMRTSQARKNYQRGYYHIEHRNNRVNNPLRSILAAAKRRARRKGIPFDLEKSDIQLGESCPCCGTAMILELGVGRAADYSPSLDRLVPELGYIRGNIEMICWKCNRLKSNATAFELQQIATWMTQRSLSGGRAKVIPSHD